VPRRVLLRWGIAAGLGSLLGCFSDRPATGPAGPPSGGTAVAVANFAFAPAALSVQTGDTVTWTNMDDVSHTVTADNAAFDSGAFGHGMTFQLTADAPGTYTYFCQIHPFMKGTLTVTP
jgi:plastocyanin